MTGRPAPGAREHSALRRFAVLVGVHVLAFVVAAAKMSGQPSKGAFDYRSDLRPGHESTTLVRGDFSGDGVPDILVAGPGHLTAFVQGSTSFDWKPEQGRAPQAPPIAAVAGRLNADSRDDLVLLCGPRPSVAEIFLSDRRNVPVLVATIDLPGDFRQVLLADPDGDGNTDLLFFGKKTLGIAVYSGNGKGAFVEGPVLFPDLPVNQAAVAPMDGDNIPDVVVSDWLSNTIQVFPGFGALNFGEPAVLRFDDEPVAFAVGDVNGDRKRDIVAGFAEPPGVAVYGGDGFGNYAASGIEQLGSPPSKIRIGDVDGDGRNDLLMFQPAAASLSIRLQDADGRLGPRQTYSTGSSPSDVAFFQDARRRMLNASVLSSGYDVVRLLHAPSVEPPEPDVLSLATGASPGDLVLPDLDDDGRPDVVLTQGGEPALSLYFNTGRGTLSGQLSVAIPQALASLVQLSAAPGVKDFLAIGGEGRSIAYLSLDPSTLTASMVSMRADSGLIPISGQKTDGEPTRRIYAVGEKHGGEGAVVYSYDLGARTSYEQAELPIEITGKVTAVSVCDFDGDRRTDLAILGITDSGAAVAFVRQTDAGFQKAFDAPISWRPSGSTPAVTFWIADLDDDARPDLIMNFLRPGNAIAVSMAGADSTFGPPRTVLTDVRVRGPRSLVVTDFDNDGSADLVYVNERTRTVQFLPGNGKGEFERPVNLTNARGVRGFGVADLNGDGAKELVLSNSDRGTLTVSAFHHPLFFRKRKP